MNQLSPMPALALTVLAAEPTVAGDFWWMLLVALGIFLTGSLSLVWICKKRLPQDESEDESEEQPPEDPPQLPS